MRTLALFYFSLIWRAEEKKSDENQIQIAITKRTET